jgi:small subunit ribosomal protein S9
MAKETIFYATGKRKTSAARVFLKPGSGKVTVNNLTIDQYIPTPAGRARALAPLALVGAGGKFDFEIKVAGGGKSSQAGAISHGITRALLAFDSEGYRATLKKAGFVTRDSRMVERKKYGLHKARKRPQFSKR